MDFLIGLLLLTSKKRISSVQYRREEEKSPLNSTRSVSARGRHFQTGSDLPREIKIPEVCTLAIGLVHVVYTWVTAPRFLG